MITRSLGNRTSEPTDRQIAVEAGDIPGEIVLERLCGSLLSQQTRDFEFIVKKAFDATGY